MKKIGTLQNNFFEKMAIFISNFFFVWVYLKQKVYFNRPNNLEDLLQLIRSKMERKVLTLLSAVYKVFWQGIISTFALNFIVNLRWLFVFV
jgi:hypothetical protein